MMLDSYGTISKEIKNTARQGSDKCKNFSDFSDYLIFSQKTLSRPVSFSGIGLHSAKDVTLTIHPAITNHGIVFKRSDVGGDKNPFIKASYENIIPLQLCTTIANDDGVMAQTIEHVLAALSGLNVTNALIEISAEEVPVLDGSAKEFSEKIYQAGILDQINFCMALHVLKPVTVSSGDAYCSLHPYNGRKFSFTVDYENKFIGKESFDIDLTDENFMREVSIARTFGLEEEVESMWNSGYALGGSLDNAVVVGKEGILNEGGVRVDSEFARHKLLDSIGDLMLAGYPVIGHFEGYKSGHHLTHQLLNKLFSDDSNYAII